MFDVEVNSQEYVLGSSAETSTQARDWLQWRVSHLPFCVEGKYFLVTQTALIKSTLALFFISLRLRGEKSGEKTEGIISFSIFSSLIYRLGFRGSPFICLGRLEVETRMHCDVDDLGAREAVVPLEDLGLGGVATLFPSREYRYRTENGYNCRTGKHAPLPTPLPCSFLCFFMFLVFLPFFRSIWFSIWLKKVNLIVLTKPLCMVSVLPLAIVSFLNSWCAALQKTSWTLRLGNQ